MNGARPCVTSLAALVHGGSAGDGWSAGTSEEWVAGRTVRRWVICEEGWDGRGRGGYMTQHIDLSLVERVRGREAHGGGWYIRRVEGKTE